MPDEALLDAWSETVEAFLDPDSPERRALDPELAATCRLTPPALAAGLAAVLGGVRRGPAAALLAEAASIPRVRSGPVLVILASNLPGLAVQPLLPALLLRRPVLLKSPSAEPLFAPAFLEALVRREPRLREGVAAAVWRGGDREIEGPLLADAGTVVAYGDRAALDDLQSRVGSRLVGYGPRTSLAVVGAEADPAAVAPGLARDVALFDQRGCLSVAAVYTAGDAEALAGHLAAALRERAAAWPPYPADLEQAAAVQQVRLAAEMRGGLRKELAPAEGTVVVEPDPAFRPSPGLRTVRVHPLADLARLPGLLAGWQDRLQGAALAGGSAWALGPALTRLGISRLAPPGELQSPLATWHNGGLHPLRALA